MVVLRTTIEYRMIEMTTHVRCTAEDLFAFMASIGPDSGQ